MNGIGPLRKLHSILPRVSLLAIYKSFIRPHLDYGNVVYDKFSNDGFTKNSKLFKGTSREKLYQELGLEHL